VVNLITNARDAITEKKSPGQITLKTWHQPVERQVCLSVSDSGIGISSQNLEDLFTPFFTTKAPGRGTGLGLSISRGIINEHDGEILVKSQVDEGSTFTIVLPARKLL
jgi:two-component system NtrC family sensor kinase